MNEDIQFIDAEQQYNAQQGTTIKDIVMNHIAKISTLCTKEFKDGYWEKKPIKMSTGTFITEVYHEDSKEAYINAIDFLHDLLLPNFDTEANNNIKDIIKNITDNKDEMDDISWKNIRLRSRRDIFQQLSKLLKRLKYLEASAVRD